MVFSSLHFILLFMPLFFICYYTVPTLYSKNMVLLLGSLIFYFIGTQKTPYHFILFVFTIMIDFFLGFAIEQCQTHKKILLLLGVCFHFICLGTFKYAGFLFSEINKLFPDFSFVPEIILPIGISFYTFQGVSYLVDVYRGTVKAEKNLLHYAIYISMFEQLIAGPIVTYNQVRKKLSKRNIQHQMVLNGLETFIFGLAMKVLLANPLGKLWTQTQTIGFESISTPLAWMAVIAYSFELYFDFFGYSLMAAGLGQMLGFQLPKNFHHPYTGLTMTEFWRRWHITLGAWFREYVYIPLGGNRRGLLCTIRNLFIVWIFTGIWHGAGYHFLLWGFILFLCIVTEKYFTGTYLSTHPVVGHLYMMFLIPVTWAIFAVENMKQLAILFSRLFPFFGQGMWSVFRYDYIKYLKQYYPFFLVAIIFSTKLPYRILKNLRNTIVIPLFLLILLFASLYCMYRGFDDPFLYFRF